MGTRNGNPYFLSKRYIPKAKWFELFSLAPVLVYIVAPRALGALKLRQLDASRPLRGSLTQTTLWFVRRKRSFMPCQQGHVLRDNFPKPLRFGYKQKKSGYFGSGYTSTTPSTRGRRRKGVGTFADMARCTR